jgi:hypothetical protein
MSLEGLQDATVHVYCDVRAVLVLPPVLHLLVNNNVLFDILWDGRLRVDVDSITDNHYPTIYVGVCKEDLHARLGDAGSIIFVGVFESFLAEDRNIATCAGTTTRC